MKTPRELLLSRHREIGPELNSVREQVLKTLRKDEPPQTSRPASFAAWMSELLGARKLVWSGLGAAWLVIIALNLAAREEVPVTPSTAPFASQQIETRQALLEQKRFFAELVGKGEDLNAGRRRFVPRPRSDRHREWSLA